MMRISLLSLAVAFSLQLAPAKDFQKKYTLPPGGLIIIENIVGDIVVRGYKGNEIEAQASKRGADSDLIEILDTSEGNRIEIHIRPTQFQKIDASVEFEIRVPNSIEYNFARLSSFGGNVEVTGVIGRLRAESVRGNVELNDITGLVSASSFSGNIDISAPSNLDAFVEMSSASGMLKSDFPLEIQESRYGPGRSARGKLGAGKQILRVRSVTGRVSLHQR
jgi:hypothetical protein